MSLREGSNVFNDAPGFEASKGERIVKALRKLWAKIEHLERARISEKKTKSSEVQTNINETDLTITDVQYKLLVLQLQYARSILRKKQAGNLCGKSKDEGSMLKQDAHAVGDIETRRHEAEASNKETQTGMSLIGDIFNNEKQSDENHWHPGQNMHDIKGSVYLQTASQCGDLPYSSSEISNLASTFPKLSSQPHYHLKLDDVPFILGASSSASHSVVANVQNIIAMMKSHNRALCGPKPRTQHPTHANSNVNKADTQDSNKMMMKLSQELSELTKRQERLKKMLDNTQKKDEFRDKCNTGMDSTKNNMNNQLQVSFNPSKDTKQQFKTKENDASCRSRSQQKPIIPSVKLHTNTVVQPNNTRRKLLRSLRDFKTHLSEEDISWE